MKEVHTPKQLVKAYKKVGSLREIARLTGQHRDYIRRRYVKAVQEGLMLPIKVGAKPIPLDKRKDKRTPENYEKRRKEAKATNEELEEQSKEPVVDGRIRALSTNTLPLPSKGRIKKYIFTSAQNNTAIFTPLWNNLQALAAAPDYNADILCARYTYMKSGLGAQGDKAKALRKQEYYGGVDMWWEPDLVKHFVDDRIEVAPGLVWCGEMNILPTAGNPLSGFESYTGRRSGIFPHTKIALQSIGTIKGLPPKFNVTTGTVTMRNYIHRKAGFKADFHHCYAGLLVEVDHEGNWWFRHLNADSDGTIYDKNVRVKNGKVTRGHRVDSIYWGDPHVEEMDPIAYALAFAPGGMKDTLRPYVEFMGDILSFKNGLSHHEIKDPHVRFLRHVQGLDNVRKGIGMAGQFLHGVKRPWCQTVAVNGNHERHLGRWLKEQDGLKDPQNAEFWIEMQKRIYAYIREGGEQEANYLEHALDHVDPKAAKNVHFLAEDSNDPIAFRCEDSQGGIYCGAHGDRGARGAKGTPRGFSRLGRKYNIGDKHACSIVDGVYVAGCMSHLDPDWTHGPSDWSHSHIVTYPNGKRAIYICYGNQWAAGHTVDLDKYLKAA